MSLPGAQFQSAAPPGVRTVVVQDTPALRPFLSVGGPYRSVAAPTWAAVRALARWAPASTVVVLDATDPAPDPGIADLVRRHPLLSVVPVLRFDRGRDATVRRLLQWGASDVIDLALEATPAALIRRLDRVHARPLKRRLEPLLPATLSRAGRTILWAAVDAVADAQGAPELAVRFETRARTVADWCRREGLPLPQQLLSWLRVLLALALLEEPDRTLANAAICAGYGAEFSLRRAVNSLVGDGEAVPRGRWSFAVAAERFRDVLWMCAAEAAAAV